MSKLPMRDDEIASSYRMAKNPAAQVKVLAELNDTTQEEIKRILAKRKVCAPPVKKASKKTGKKARHHWTEEELNRAEEMIRQGYSYRQIGEELGMNENATRATVWKRMQMKKAEEGKYGKQKQG